MEKIIDVEVKTQKGDFGQIKTDLLCIGFFADGAKVDRRYAEIDKKLGGGISEVLKLGDFKGKTGTSAVLYGGGRIGAKRVLLVGLGEKKKATLDTVREAAALAGSQVVELKAGRMVAAFHQIMGDKYDVERMGQAIAEGVYIGSYRYDEFVTKKTNGRGEKLTAIVADTDAGVVRKLARGVSLGNVMGRGQCFARTIANRPGNVINPPALAAIARRLARETAGLSCTVFDEKQLKQKQMGGILAVGGGSANKPRLIVLKYKARGNGKRLRVGLVGKAVTFDSGGISIKPSAGMDRMKLDKSGGIAVLATVKAAAELGLPINVYGVIPSAENLPSGTSYRPGDIVRTFSGKTVEVQNTDAEGRMILCDALSYAAEQKCEVIIDIATLTGACMVALGKYKAGLMGNDEGLVKQLQAASEASGEKVWPLPIGEEYLEEMKSKVADLKNIGSKWGGACTAAAFLGEFVGDTKWAHIDMAGVDMFEESKKYHGVGATGFGVRLLTTYLVEAAKKSTR